MLMGDVWPIANEEALVAVYPLVRALRPGMTRRGAPLCVKMTQRGLSPVCHQLKEKE